MYGRLGDIRHRRSTQARRHPLMQGQHSQASPTTAAAFRRSTPRPTRSTTLVSEPAGRLTDPTVGHLARPRLRAATAGSHRRRAPRPGSGRYASRDPSPTGRTYRRRVRRETGPLPGGTRSRRRPGRGRRLDRRNPGRRQRAEQRQQMPVEERANTPPHFSQEKLIAIVEELGDLASALRHAEPEHKLEFYRSLGLNLTYNPETQTVRASVDLATHRWISLVSEGGLEPPRPIRALAPQASASAIPPPGPARPAYPVSRGDLLTGSAAPVGRTGHYCTRPRWIMHIAASPRGFPRSRQQRGGRHRRPVPDPRGRVAGNRRFRAALLTCPTPPP